jgi:hypothetical protein
LAAAQVLDNSVTATLGVTTVVVVFALTVYKVIQATCVGTIRKVPKAAKAVKVNIATKAVAIKAVVCLEFSKAAMAGPAVQIQQKVVPISMNMVIWHSACFHMAHDAIQTIVSDQRQLHRPKLTGGISLIFAVVAAQVL